jgi:hypothetical protein
MVYEHFLRCFIPNDPSLRFSKLFQINTTIHCGDIPRSVAIVLGVSKLLAMAKDTSGVHLIVVGEIFLQLISYSIVL